MLALQEYAKPSSATSVHGEKLMSALQEYATSRNAKWLHGEKVDVCIVTSIQYPAGLWPPGENVDASITQVCCTQYVELIARVCYNFVLSRVTTARAMLTHHAICHKSCNAHMRLLVLRCYGHRATTSSATSKQGWAYEYIAASQVYKHACVAETLGLQLSAQAKLGRATSSGSSD